MIVTQLQICSSDRREITAHCSLQSGRHYDEKREIAQFQKTEFCKLLLILNYQYVVWSEPKGHF